MLLRITGLGLHSHSSEVRVEYDQWIGLDEPSGRELLKKLQIVGVTQWHVSHKPKGWLDLTVANSNVSQCIRLIKHVLFQHFPDATIQAIYVRYQMSPVTLAKE